MKTPQFCISNRRFKIPMTKIPFNVMSQIYHGWNHTEYAVPKYQESLIYFYHRGISLYAKSPVTTWLSCVYVKDPFARNFTTIITCFYVIHYYYTYSQRQGSVWYPNHIPYISMWDSIKKISNNIPWIVSRLRFPAFSIHYLYRIVN